MIEEARAAASICCQIAYQRAAGLAEPRERWSATARSLARQLLGITWPDLDWIASVIGEMRDRISAPSLAFRDASGHPMCGAREGYVIGSQPSIYLCEAFFNETLERRIQTLIHEAAHRAGIGEATKEEYCPIFDCATPCGGSETADAWAHYIHCLSGQRAEQGEVIDGRSKAHARQLPHPPASDKGHLQRRAASPSEATAVPPIVHDVLRSPGQPLDAATRTFMEPRFGQDFAQVRVHTDARAAASARAVNALAYTVGRNVVFGAGQYAPGTTEGRRLMAHELTHVVQQQDNPAEIMQQAGHLPSDPFEQEAEQVAEQIVLPAASASPLRSISRSPTAMRRQAVALDPARQSPSLIQPASTPQVLESVSQALRTEANKDAHWIKQILQSNEWLAPWNEDAIMEVVAKWMRKPLENGSRLTPFDYLINALRNVTFEVGWITKQHTGAFDQLFSRLSPAKITQFKRWMQSRGRIFRNEQAIEEVKLEISKEDVIRGVKVGGELALAVGSGGTSVLGRILLWLATELPEIYAKAHMILDTVNAIQTTRLDDLQQIVSAKGIGNLLVKALFGEVQGLPDLPLAAKEQEETEKEPAAERGGKGLTGMLRALMKLVRTLKKVYNRVMEYVHKGLTSINITRKSWFSPLAMAYSAIVSAIEAISDPAVVLRQMVGKLREVVSNFFHGIRGRFDTIASEIKAQITFLVQPARILSMLADQAVEWVLNLLITHPPTEALKQVFTIIQGVSGKSIIQLVRENFRFADDLIKEVADSDTVKRLIQPLKPPVSRIVGAVDDVVTRAGNLTSGAENKALGILTDGVGMVKELTGIDPVRPIGTEGAPPQPARTQRTAREAESGQQGAPSSLTEFLAVLKAGFHSRLLEIGGRLLAEKATALGKASLEKGTAVAKGFAGKIKGVVLGEKVPFAVLGEHHELWVEKQDREVFIFVASQKMEILQKIEAYKYAINDIKDAKKKQEAMALFSELETLSREVRFAAKTKNIASPKRIRMTKILAVIDKTLEKRFKSARSATQFAAKENAVTNPTTGEALIVSKVGKAIPRGRLEENMEGATAVGLPGWHRAHLVGPGTGKEFHTGIMYATRSYNLSYHKYLENTMRGVAEVLKNNFDMEVWQRCRAMPTTANKFQIHWGRYEIFTDDGNLLEDYTITERGNSKNPKVDENYSEGWKGLAQAFRK
ncbi:DUF4157 domain-containing protein [Candidatus Chloroploca sp. M-50]|uniref:DUF4157 domain-containing protein n=1 Tax=Candidatus Chloroploca mongolica TaxID=2528176 RepID=A0ABS4DF61_9CHLR|nr:DUF4157 domain-containing protein [Candidatus Chloroploca mongolica]MBP1468094.1 DUF4157 domain-containing protein [Candidatus Chloroploca mongolica]